MIVPPSDKTILLRVDSCPLNPHTAWNVFHFETKGLFKAN